MFGGFDGFDEIMMDVGGILKDIKFLYYNLIIVMIEYIRNSVSPRTKLINSSRIIHGLL